MEEEKKSRNIEKKTDAMLNLALEHANIGPRSRTKAVERYDPSFTKGSSQKRKVKSAGSLVSKNKKNLTPKTTKPTRKTKNLTKKQENDKVLLITSTNNNNFSHDKEKNPVIKKTFIDIPISQPSLLIPLQSSLLSSASLPSSFSSLKKTGSSSLPCPSVKDLSSLSFSSLGSANSSLTSIPTTKCKEATRSTTTTNPESVFSTEMIVEKTFSKSSLPLTDPSLPLSEPSLPLSEPALPLMEHSLPSKKNEKKESHDNAAVGGIDTNINKKKKEEITLFKKVVMPNDCYRFLYPIGLQPKGLDVQSLHQDIGLAVFISTQPHKYNNNNNGDDDDNDKDALFFKDHGAAEKFLQSFTFTKCVVPKRTSEPEAILEIMEHQKLMTEIYKQKRAPTDLSTVPATEWTYQMFTEWLLYTRNPHQHPDDESKKMALSRALSVQKEHARMSNPLLVGVSRYVRYGPGMKFIFYCEFDITKNVLSSSFGSVGSLNFPGTLSPPDHADGEGGGKKKEKEEVKKKKMWVKFFDLVGEPQYREFLRSRFSITQDIIAMADEWHGVTTLSRFSVEEWNATTFFGGGSGGKVNGGKGTNKRPAANEETGQGQGHQKEKIFDYSFACRQTAGGSKRRRSFEIEEEFNKFSKKVNQEQFSSFKQSVLLQEQREKEKAKTEEDAAALGPAKVGPTKGDAVKKKERGRPKKNETVSTKAEQKKNKKEGNTDEAITSHDKITVVEEEPESSNSAIDYQKYINFSAFGGNGNSMMKKNQKQMFDLEFTDHSQNHHQHQKPKEFVADKKDDSEGDEEEDEDDEDVDILLELQKPSFLKKAGRPLVKKEKLSEEQVSLLDAQKAEFSRSFRSEAEEIQVLSSRPPKKIPPCLYFYDEDDVLDFQKGSVTDVSQKRLLIREFYQCNPFLDRINQEMMRTHGALHMLTEFGSPIGVPTFPITDLVPVLSKKYYRDPQSRIVDVLLPKNKK